MTLHVGGPSSEKRIHWHANPNLKVEFVATDPDRQTIPWVKVTRPDGSVQEYAAEGVTRGTACRR